MQNAALSRRIGTEIQLGNKIGGSLFSKVRIGYRDGKEYAVKYTKMSIPKKREDIHKQLENEIEALTALQHPNIVKLHGHGYTGWYTKEYKDRTAETEIAYSVLDKPRQGTLIDIIYYAGAMNERIVRFYFKQLLSAVKYIHNSNYAHRNLKLTSLFIGNDYNLLLSGFKYTKKISSGSKDSDGFMSRKSAMCPQSLQSQKCDLIMDDLFALGYILFIMLYKVKPFEAATVTDLKYKLIYEHKMENFWAIFSKIETSNEVKDLLSSMLAFESYLRPSIGEIEASAWMNGETPILQEIQKEIESKMYTTETRLKEEAMKRKMAKQEQHAGKSGNKVPVMTSLAGTAPHVTRTIQGPTSSFSSKPKKQVKPLCSEIVAPTHVYSMEHPDHIEDALVSYVVSSASEFKSDDKKYKVMVLNQDDKN